MANTYTYKWIQRIGFFADVQVGGGSDNVGAESDGNRGHLGRYPRMYVRQGQELPVGTITIMPLLKRRDAPDCNLSGVPFSTPEEQDEAYRLFAEAGLVMNDMTEAEKKVAMGKIAAFVKEVVK